MFLEELTLALPFYLTGPCPPARPKATARVTDLPDLGQKGEVI